MNDELIVERITDSLGGEVLLTEEDCENESAGGFVYISKEMKAHCDAILKNERERYLVAVHGR